MIVDTGGSVGKWWKAKYISSEMVHFWVLTSRFDHYFDGRTIRLKTRKQRAQRHNLLPQEEISDWTPCTNMHFFFFWSRNCMLRVLLNHLVVGPPLKKKKESRSDAVLFNVNNSSSSLSVPQYFVCCLFFRKVFIIILFVLSDVFL